MMRHLFVVLMVVASLISGAIADLPPAYEEYGMGAVMIDHEPFPKLITVAPAGPAGVAGLQNEDLVLAINGVYSKSGIPYYYFERSMKGPANSEAEVVVLRKGTQVIVVKVRRTIKAKSNW